MGSGHRAFEFFLRGARPLLADRYGGAFAADVLAAARVEYERVLPEVPDIGGAGNVFQPVMTVNGWIVALHRAMQARGKGAEDAIRICQHVFDGWLRKLPGFLLRAIGWALLSTPARWYFESQARRSRERRHPLDFVWHVERDEAGVLSLIFDECAVNKWYAAQDVLELGPYCSFADVTYSRLMGMGVDASETIGLGCERCALRYRRGRETLVPPALAGIVGGE
jgi:hypothetical protein